MIKFFAGSKKEDNIMTEKHEFFNMQTIGAKISSLRKSKNMTQADLADHMGVSFQAVSNWERGVSMPDIAKLGELSALFGVSIDEILNNKRTSSIVQDIIEEKPLDKIDTEDLIQIAPLVKPEKIENAFKSKTMSLKDLAAAAPFLSESALNKLFGDMVIEGDNKVTEIAAIAPFLSSEALKKALMNCELQGKLLTSLAPFLDEGDLGEIIDKGINGSLKLNEIRGIFPFLDERGVETLINKLDYNEKYDIALLTELAPFALEEALDKLLENLDIDEAAENPFMVTAIAPFASEKSITKFAFAIIKKHGLNAALPLLPFTDSKALDKLYTD